MSGCAERREELSALLDGALTEAEARSLEEHLAACAACQAEREALAHVVEQVRALPREVAPAHFTAAVMALVIDEPARVAVAPPVESEVVTCAELAEDVVAHADGELVGAPLRRLEAHLGRCATCDAEVWAQQMLHAKLRTLPRVRPPASFAKEVLALLEAEDAAQAERRRREQLAWWGQVGWVARAAGVLAAAALSLQLTLPESVGPGALRLPGARQAQQLRPQEGGGAETPPPPPPIDFGALDATLELRAPRGVAAGFAAAFELAEARGQVLQERLTEEQGDLHVSVTAKVADDLYRELDALVEVDGTPAAARAIEAVAIEEDRVALKNGVVLAGRVESDDARQVVIVTGGMRQTLRRASVDRVELAERLERRLRITLRGPSP